MPLQLKGKPPTEDEATKLAKPVLLKDGIRQGYIRDALETKAQKSGRDMIVLTVVVADDDGNERELPVYLHAGNAGILLLLHACKACNAEPKYTAGLISAEDFSGHDVLVKIGTEKKARWPARNVILDVLPVEGSAVVPLRAAG